MAPISLLRAGALILLLFHVARGNPVITEIMADNISFLADEDGHYSDWIEIHNPDATPVDLTDWSLTDDDEDLTKWKFPAVTLQPGEFLVVWASGKNKRTPGLPLHTKFSLGKDGEYLALVRPGGTVIEQQFAPAYPALDPNESYGLQFTTTNFVASGASARYLVPPNDSLGTTWTTPGFNATTPTNWGTGPTGLGFGLLVPGISVRNVRKNGLLNNLTAVDELLALPPGDSQILEDVSVIVSSVNFLDDGNAGHFAFDQVFPLGGGDNHCIKATGTIQIPTTGQWTFGINSADGGRIKIDGTAVATDNGTHGAADRIGSRFINTVGAHTFEVVMWNASGDGEVEFYAAPGLITAWSSAFRLVGDTANGGLASTTLQPGVSNNIVATNIATSMQNVNSSCYVRVPFNATGPGALTSLQLKMRYNDGYIAYLNGATKIAERNAPASPAFNSTSTAARTVADSVTVESVNVTAFIPQLINGSNVLAIHGLNTTAADGTFLVLPELIGGSLTVGAQAVFFDSTKATPGSVNGAYSLLGKVEDTAFSVDRGFFTAPFSLAITTLTPGATIRYTTNGSEPTATTGTVYTGPIAISATTVIRAAAFKTGYEPTNIDTQTYIFLGDVITQSPTGAPPAGWPAGPINGQVLDYGMDPDIVNNGNPAIGGSTVVQNALKAISTVSIVTDQKNLTDAGTGIYVHPSGRGFAWERACSMEWINPPDATHPNGTGEFQINCGIRIRGGFSRDPNNPKHGFHMYFREDYGSTKLNYPLFGRYGADEFDQLDLRTAQNYSWSFSPGDGNANSFMREESSRQTQLDMGHHTGRLRYFHLYINGHYWGLFNTEERTEASFCETYYGGAKDNYDVIKCEQTQGYTTGFTDGNLAAWQDLWNKSKTHLASPTNANYFKLMGRAADGVTPTADPVLLDVDNLIDFLLLNFWMGNADGAASPTANNWFGGRDRTGAHGGFKFFTHDFEHSMLSTGEDRTGPYINSNYANFSYSTPMFVHQDLMANAEFKIRWADRVHKHMFNGGQLTPEAWTARLNKLAAIVDSTIIAESARWGDSKSPTAPFTRANWLNVRNYLFNSYIPVRGPIVLAQLRADGLYPALDAPVVTPFGGYVSAGSEAVITAVSGTIYHMPDGSDPRAVGGAIRPGALIYTSGTTNETLIAASSNWKYLDNGSNQNTAWRNPGFNDTSWPSGNAELGYGDNDETTRVEDNATPGYNGPDLDRYATTYFRKTFTVTDTTNVTGANISLKFDDQAWVYLDGALIVKTNPGMPDNPAFDFYTVVNTPDENVFFNYPIDPALLTPGVHTLAVEVHQGGAGSSDMSFNLALTLTRTTSPTPLYLTGAAVRPLKVRAHDGANWSALVDATFLIDTDPASSANLAISEIMYHPAEPSAAEIAAGFTDSEDFEFIEFVNISTRNVDLSGLYLYGSINFDFANSLIGRILAPGARVILASKKSAFEFRYGTGKPVAGSYSGQLNNAGERVVLYNAADAGVIDVTYGTESPWPEGTDGQGYSLVRISPDGIPVNDNNPARWRHSATIGGNAGVSDALSFPAWKTANGVTSNTADGESDGLNNINEYFLGGSIAVADTNRLPRAGIAGFSVASVPGNYATLTFTRRFAADDATCVVETAPAATGPWTPNGVFVSATANGDGTETYVYRAPNPQTANGPQLFLHLRAQITP